MRSTKRAAVALGLTVMLGACGGGEAAEPEATTTSASVAEAPDRVDAVVWLAPDATQGTIDEVRDALDGAGATSQYIDKAASLAAFQRAFADDPAALGQVDVAQLPTSFQVSADDVDAVEAAVDGIDGVLQVARPPGADEIAARRAELDAAEARLAEPRAIVVWLVPGTDAAGRGVVETMLTEGGATSIEFVDEDGALEALRAAGGDAGDGPVEPGQLPTFLEADNVAPATIEALRTTPGVLEVVDSAITAEAIAQERAQLDQLEADLG